MKEEDIMDNAIANKLRENYVVDLKKPDIDSFERAVIIRKVLDERKWSIREMARQWGFSKSTIEDWLLFNKISEAEYEKLIKKGMTPTTIYRELRARKTQEKVKIIGLDNEMRTLTKNVKKAILKLEYSTETQVLINNLKNELNRLESAISRDINKVKEIKVKGLR